MNQNNDVFASMDVGVDDGSHTVAQLYPKHEHTGGVIALGSLGRPRFRLGACTEVIEIDEASKLPDYAEMEKWVAAHIADCSGFGAFWLKYGYGVKDASGPSIADQVADAVGVPREYLSPDLLDIKSAIRRLDAGYERGHAWLKRLLARQRLGNKLWNQPEARQQPRKRRSGGRLVSKNERRARTRNSSHI